MAQNLTREILLALKDTALVTGDIITTFLEVPYGSSYNRMQRSIDQKARERGSRAVAKRLDKHNFRNLLSKLKRDGLVSRDGDIWNITKFGLERLLKKRNGLPAGKYKKEVEQTLKLVMFDIPERDRKKRDWLRDCLRNLGFKMAQKSVWVGKTKLPKDFMIDLRKLRLVNYVDVLEITKTGSLLPVKE